MLSAAPALAQDAADAPEASQIIVTGSRIVRDGYSAPTPVTVMSQADIAAQAPANISDRSEEHTSELQSLMRNSYAVFCLTKKKKNHKQRSGKKRAYTNN